MRTGYLAPGIGLLVLGCFAVFGADSWRDKASSDWTPDEIRKILNDSPWAQQARMEMGERSGGMGRGGWGGRGGGMGGGGGMGAPGGGGGWGGSRGGGWGGGRGGPGGEGGWGGNRGGEGGGGGPREVTVRWQSALPVQQALARQTEATAPAAAPDASEYIIAVAGLPNFSGRRRRDTDTQDNSGQTDEERRQAFLDRMKESTTLTPKGKSPFGPDKVERAADGTLLFYFPKAEEELSLDDHEVEFATHMGPMELKHKFKLKEMTWQGKLAL